MRSLTAQVVRLPDGELVEVVASVVELVVVGREVDELFGGELEPPEHEESTIASASTPAPAQKVGEPARGLRS